MLFVCLYQCATAGEEAAVNLMRRRVESGHKSYPNYL